MWIEVSGAFAFLLLLVVHGGAQIHRHIAAHAVDANIVGSSLRGFEHRIRFRRHGNIDGGFEKGSTGVRHAQTLHRLPCTHRGAQCCGISHAHVLGSGDDNTTGQESRIFTCVEHAGRPIDGGIRVGAAHRLNERTGHVVLVFETVARHVGNDCAHIIRLEDRDLPVAHGGNRAGRRRFQRGQGSTGVAAAADDDELAGFRIEAHSALEAAFIHAGAIEDLLQVLEAELVQMHNHATAEECGRQTAARRLGGCGDEVHHALFDHRQQNVLLVARHAVHLINKQDAFLVTTAQSGNRGERRHEIVGVQVHGGKLHQMAAGILCHELREGGLAGSWGTVEQCGARDGDSAGCGALCHEAERGARGGDLFLTHHILKPTRPHSFGQGLQMLLSLVGIKRHMPSPCLQTSMPSVRGSATCLLVRIQRRFMPKCDATVRCNATRHRSKRRRSRRFSNPIPIVTPHRACRHHKTITIRSNATIRSTQIDTDYYGANRFGAIWKSPRQRAACRAWWSIGL